MKKTVYILLALVGMAFASCNKQNDVVDDIVDHVNNTPKAYSVEYTLVDADYNDISAAAAKDVDSVGWAPAAVTDSATLAKAVATDKMLNQFATANKYVPAILKNNFPGLKQGSSVTVTYNYTASDALAYLNTLTDSPVDLILTEDFSEYAANAIIDQNGWSQYDETGTGKWVAGSYKENFYAKTSSYGDPAEVNNVYLVSPAIDLTGYQTPVLSFALEPYKPVTGQDYLRVLIATDYDATAHTATWTDVTDNFDLPADDAAATMVSVGEMSLADYVGQTIYIAFKYQGDDTVAPVLTTTVEFGKIRVVQGDPTLPMGSGEVYQKQDDGTFALYDNGIALTPDMLSIVPETLTKANAPQYIPALLDRYLQKLPVEGQKEAVLFNGNAVEYTYTGGQWTPSAQAVVRTEQYVYADNGWMFDPTINLTMAQEDYQLVVDYVLAQPGMDVYDDADYPGEAEFYYGFNWFYKNISFRPSDHTMPEDTELHALDGDSAAQSKLLWKRLIEEAMPIYLRLKWPNAPVDVQGVPMVYNITASVYYPDYATNFTGVFTLSYKVLTAGSASAAPSFQYVSGAEDKDNVYYTPDAAE